MPVDKFYFILFFNIFIIIINKNYITFTIRTNNTYNTLEYKQKEKKIRLHSLLRLAKKLRYFLQSTKKSNIQLL